MPSPIEERWREVGVLTRAGAPNAAMKNWAECLTAGKESEVVLREILLILSLVYKEGSASAFETDEDVGITA